jgi:hypothetical protein
MWNGVYHYFAKTCELRCHLLKHYTNGVTICLLIFEVIDAQFEASQHGIEFHSHMKDNKYGRTFCTWKGFRAELITRLGLERYDYDYASASESASSAVLLSLSWRVTRCDRSTRFAAFDTRYCNTEERQ